MGAIVTVEALAVPGGLEVPPAGACAQAAQRWEAAQPVGPTALLREIGLDSQPSLEGLFAWKLTPLASSSPPQAGSSCGSPPSTVTFEASPGCMSIIAHHPCSCLVALSPSCTC